jgi:hypothetical protein
MPSTDMLQRSIAGSELHVAYRGPPKRLVRPQHDRKHRVVVVGGCEVGEQLLDPVHRWSVHRPPSVRAQLEHARAGSRVAGARNGAPAGHRPGS